MRVHLVTLALCLVTRPLLADQAGILPYQDPTAVAAGEKIYAEHCATCHGADLEGEPNWKTRDADGYAPAPPHDVSGHTWHHPDRQLFDLTKHGPAQVVGQGYRSRMPGYAGILSDHEIVAVLAFIKSTWPAHIRARHNDLNANSQ